MIWDKAKLNRKKPKDFPLTADDRGWVKWIKGRGTVRICGKVSIEEALDLYESRYKEIHFGSEPAPIASDDLSVKDLAALFMARQQERLQTGRPRRLSRRTYNDYRITLDKFLACVGSSTAVGDLSPSHFSRFGRTIKGDSPYQLANAVAYLSAFFNWGYKAEQIKTLPRFGPDFVKPDKQARDMHRQSIEKRFTPKEIRRLWIAGKPLHRAWLALGVNCAFNNSDLAHLTKDAVDLTEGVIDFRRRKVGAIRRICPLRPETAEALRAYERPQPIDEANADLFFLTRHGRPFGREKETFVDGDLDKATPIDAVSSEFGKLMDAADVKRDGRGYSGLRTTFRTLADPLPDERAIDTITGHRSRTQAHISAQYVEHVDPKRLKAVVDHVWSAIWPRRCARWFAALKKREVDQKSRTSSPEPTPSAVRVPAVRPSTAPAGIAGTAPGRLGKSAHARQSGSGRAASASRPAR